MIKENASGILWLCILYFLMVNMISAAAIIIDIWLGIKEHLGANAAATVISCIAVTRISQGLIGFSNKGVLVMFALVAGLSSLAFLMFLHFSSDIMEHYESPSISLIKASTVVVFNGLVFIGVAFLSERKPHLGAG